MAETHITEQDLEERIADTIVAHANNYTDVKQRWTDLLNRYENKLREDSITASTDSKALLGGAYALVENFVARMLNRQPKYKYLGREGDDVKDADLYEEFSEYQFAEAGAETELEEIARWGGATGLAGWVMGWKQETKIVAKDGIEILGIQTVNPVVMSLSSALGKGKKVKVDEKQTIANYTIDAIKPHDLIWNIDARSMKDIRILGYRTERFVKDLEYEGYDVSALKTSILSSDFWTDKISANKDKGLSQDQILGMQKVIVAPMYVKYLDNGIWKNSLMTMAGLESGKPVKIQYTERPFDEPFIPMGIFTPIRRLGKFYGFGLIEPAMGILDGEEDSLNIALTALWTDVARPMEYNPQNILDMDSFEYGARKLVPVRTLGQSVAVMPTPQPNIAGVNIMLQYLQRAKQNEIGITDFQTGADQISGGKTLGEIKIKTAESNARIQKMTRNFELQVLEPIGKFALYMNKQFLSDKPKIVYRIMGRKGAMLEKAIKSKDIEAIKDINVISGSTALVEQQSELQKWTAVLNQVYMEEKSPNPTTVNKEPIWERLFADGLLVPDIETYLPNAQEVETKNVGVKMSQLDDAEAESDTPATARVLPTDDHALHLKIHQAVLNSGMKSTGQPLSPEETQMLSSHVNDHARAMGGQVPAFAQGIEGAVNQHVMNQVPQVPQMHK